MSARRLALRRACVVDTALLQGGTTVTDEERYTGKVNTLPSDVHKDLFTAFPLGLLHDNCSNEEDDNEDDDAAAAQLVEQVAANLERISVAVDESTAAAVDPTLWKETVLRLQQQGRELLDMHRDMYLAALEEGQKREAEAAMTAHLLSSSTGLKKQTVVMTPERVQRLSLFRVQRFYEQINQSKQALQDWSYTGQSTAAAAATSTDNHQDMEGSSSSSSCNSQGGLDPNWPFTAPFKVGDKVEADSGGAMFPATVAAIHGNDGEPPTFDVHFFDGDQESGMLRSQIKLLQPPKVVGGAVDTSSMTPKQLKRWKKQQEKLHQQ